MKFNKKFLFYIQVLLPVLFVSNAFATGKAPTGDPTYIKCYGVNIEKDVMNSNGFYGQRAIVAWLDNLYYGTWFDKTSNNNNNFFQVKTDSTSKNVIPCAVTV